MLQLCTSSKVLITSKRAAMPTQAWLAVTACRYTQSAALLVQEDIVSYTLVGRCVWHQQAILVAYTNTHRFRQLRVRDQLL